MEMRVCLFIRFWDADRFQVLTMGSQEVIST